MGTKKLIIAAVVLYLAYRAGQGQAQTLLAASPGGSAANPITGPSEWWTYAGHWGA